MSDLKFLTEAEILAAHDIASKVVEVPQWGGCVRVQGLSKAQQQAMRRDANGPDGLDTDTMELLMFKYGVAEPKFSDAGIQALKEKSSAAFDLVLQEIIKVSGVSEEAIKQAEAEFPKLQ